MKIASLAVVVAVALISGCDTSVTNAQASTQEAAQAHWQSKYFRLDNTNSWRDEIVRDLERDRPAVGNVRATISVSGNKVDVHFWWKPGDGPEWRVIGRPSTPQDWQRFAEEEPNAVPIGFYSDQGNDWTLWFLRPLQKQ